MLGVILSAVFVIMVGYLMVGISGYLAFPTTVQGNILKSFPADDILMQACTIFRLITLCGSPCMRARHCRPKVRWFALYACRTSM